MSLLIILCFAGVVATFVSHTVASIILMPIISKIGVTLGMPEVMVVSSAFAGWLETSRNILFFFSFPPLFNYYFIVFFSLSRNGTSIFLIS